VVLRHFGDVSSSQSLGLVWKKLNVTQQNMHSPIKRNVGPTATQNKHRKQKPGLVAFTTSGLEMEWVYSQRKRQVRKEISKEKVKKKMNWERIRFKTSKQYISAVIKNRTKGALRPGTRTGPTKMLIPQKRK